MHISSHAAPTHLGTVCSFDEERCTYRAADTLRSSHSPTRRRLMTVVLPPNPSLPFRLPAGRLASILTPPRFANNIGAPLTRPLQSEPATFHALSISSTSPDATNALDPQWLIRHLGRFFLTNFIIFGSVYRRTSVVAFPQPWDISSI